MRWSGRGAVEPDGARVVEADGVGPVPTVVTRTGRRRGRSRCRGRRRRRGAAGDGAPVVERLGGRFAPASGITPTSTSPMASSPPASTSAYVKRSVPVNVSSGRVDDRAVRRARWRAARRLGGDVLEAMMSPSGSVSLATTSIVDRTPAAGAGDVGAGDRRPVDLVGGTMRTSRNAPLWLPALVGDGVAEREAGDRRRGRPTRRSPAVGPGAQRRRRRTASRDHADGAALGVVVVGQHRRQTLPPARTSTTSGGATGGWSTTTVSVTATTTTPVHRVGAPVGDLVAERRRGPARRGPR